MMPSANGFFYKKKKNCAEQRLKKYIYIYIIQHTDTLRLALLLSPVSTVWLSARDIAAARTASDRAEAARERAVLGAVLGRSGSAPADPAGCAIPVTVARETKKYIYKNEHTKQQVCVSTGWQSGGLFWHHHWGKERNKSRSTFRYYYWEQHQSSTHPTTAAAPRGDASRCRASCLPARQPSVKTAAGLPRCAGAGSDYILRISIENREHTSEKNQKKKNYKIDHNANQTAGGKK
jgi:hypothetical protein